MKHVPLERLEARIIRPGIEAHLAPLLRFKGNQTLGRLHRMWNLMVSAMEHDASLADITQRLILRPEVSQICEPDKPVPQSSLRSFCGRLLAHPDVMKEEAHLEEYIRGLFPPYKQPFALTPLQSPPDGFAEAVNNQSIHWAAEQYGVDWRTACRWFTELGLESNPYRRNKPDNFAEIAGGKSLGWAVEEYGVSYFVARRWFEESAIDPVGRKLLLPEEFAEIANGKNLGWVIEEFGVGYSVARRWFMEAGISPALREKRPLPPSWGHFASRESNAELAERYAATPHTIRRWRMESGVLCTIQRTTARPSELVYPFVVHDGGKPEHRLMRLVNAAVPKGLDPDLRADICQDLVVGILCGDFNEDDLALPAKEVAKRVQKMFPTKYGPLSLDEVIPGTDGLRLIDTLSDEDALWAQVA